jgi:hypothetical protein
MTLPLVDIYCHMLPELVAADGWRRIFSRAKAAR